MFKNYKSPSRSFKANKPGTQKLFHGHYIQDDRDGKDDSQFTSFSNDLNEPEGSCLQYCCQEKRFIVFLLQFLV